LIFLLSLLKTFPVSPPKNEHGHGHYGKKDKNIGILGVDAPQGGNLIKGYGRYGQV